MLSAACKVFTISYPVLLQSIEIQLNFNTKIYPILLELEQRVQMQPAAISPSDAKRV